MRATPSRRAAATALCLVLCGAAAGPAVAQQSPDDAQIEGLPQIGGDPPLVFEPEPAPEPSPTPQARQLPNTGTEPATVALLGAALIAAGAGLRLRLR